MKKTAIFLIQFIMAFSCFSAELEKAIYDYNNNKDGFKNQEIANLDKKFIKKTNRDDFLLFYDKDDNLIKIEEESESESGDVLTKTRQYYENNNLIYFEYLIDVIPDPSLNFVIKGYIKDKKIDKYKFFGNEIMKKKQIGDLMDDIEYPITPLWIKSK